MKRKALLVDGAQRIGVGDGAGLRPAAPPAALLPAPSLLRNYRRLKEAAEFSSKATRDGPDNEGRREGVEGRPISLPSGRQGQKS